MRSRVDHDAIAVGDERDRPAVDRLRRDVADAEPVGAAREAPVGDERGVGAATGALHRARDREHLAHPGATLRPLVADHDDVARVDAPGEDRVHRARPRRRRPGRRPRSAARRSRRPSRPSLPARASRAGPRCRPGCGSGRTAGARPRRRARAASRSARFSAIVLPVTVRQSPWSRPAVEQLLHHDLHPTDAVEVGHVVLAVRLHVGDVRDTRADPVEVVELELHAGLVGDGEQVQHRVGRPAERHGRPRSRSRTPPWS